MFEALVDGKEITLPVHGRKMTVSKEEFISILVQYFNNKETEAKTFEVVQTITVCKGFVVNPNSINQKLFQKYRKDSSQEWTRKIILEAFIEVEKNPAKYAKTFITMMPEKTWLIKSIKEMNKLAVNMGGHIADWVEQALEWAQRIDNGEAWEAICNDPDTAEWHRLVRWKNGYYRFVGGASKIDHIDPASYVSDKDFDISYTINLAVPSIVCPLFS